MASICILSPPQQGIKTGIEVVDLLRPHRESTPIICISVYIAQGNDGVNQAQRDLVGN